MAANAWTVTYAKATYAFTGVVTSSDFSTLPIGAYVTGTYTFNYNSADQIIGFHGSAIGGPPDVIYFGAGIGGWALCTLYQHRAPGDPDGESKRVRWIFDRQRPIT
jgi:hypothetical protein